MVPYIKTAPANEITIQASFRMEKCYTHEDCWYSFGVYAWKTSRNVSSTWEKKMSSDFKFAGRLETDAADYTFENNRFKFFRDIKLKIEMEGNSGIYLAFDGSEAIVRIDKLTAHYKICPQEFKNGMMKFPRTPAPNSTMKVERVSGFCAKSTVPAKDKRNIALNCYADGTSNVTGICICAPGFLWSQPLRECLCKFF